MNGKKYRKRYRKGFQNTSYENNLLTLNRREITSYVEYQLTNNGNGDIIGEKMGRFESYGIDEK